MIVYRPLLKVSRLQVRLASILGAGATIIRRDDLGCTQQTWRHLREDSGLERIDGRTARATQQSDEWVYNVRCHLALRKRRPRLARPPMTDRERLQRKIRRAARAGVLTSPTHSRGDGEAS